MLPTWYWRTDWPASQTALPAAETLVNTAFVLPAAMTSAMRPPQPNVAPSGASACQVFCWSLCEYRLLGFGCELWPYCSFDVGSTSGPTLGAMASRLSVSNIDCSVPISGCSAKMRPQ